MLNTIQEAENDAKKQVAAAREHHDTAIQAALRDAEKKLHDAAEKFRASEKKQVTEVEAKAEAAAAKMISDAVARSNDSSPLSDAEKKVATDIYKTLIS